MVTLGQGKANFGTNLGILIKVREPNTPITFIQLTELGFSKDGWTAYTWETFSTLNTLKTSNPRIPQPGVNIYSSDTYLTSDATLFS